jgi:LmbE family N-acetylglucosaminyl deacetylase
MLVLIVTRAVGGLMEASDGGGGEQLGRILVVDDDPALGEFLRRVLGAGGYEVAHELDSEGALRQVPSGQWDLLITDIELPGMSGLELLERVRELVPGLPVAVLTGHPTVDYTAGPLRQAAAEFLQKPIRRADLLAKANELVEAGRAARTASRETVLAIGAHPDDVEIGAGGTLAAHGAAGDVVAILTLSHAAGGQELAERGRAGRAAADILGARLFLRDLEDTHIPEGNPTIAMIEEVIEQVQPTVVYTHSIHDLRQDHRSVHRAALVACRQVSRMYCFQSPSATIDYRPTHFVGVDDYLSRKLKVVGSFGSQAPLRDYMEPELITATARYWARYATGTFAEPFETARDRGRLPRSRSGPAPLAGIV